MSFQPDYFTITRDLGEMHPADIDRVRSLINPEALPSKAREVTGGALNSPCSVCGFVPCGCPGEAE